jgi:hypothetical protein
MYLCCNTFVYDSRNALHVNYSSFAANGFVWKLLRLISNICKLDPGDCQVLSLALPMITTEPGPLLYQYELGDPACIARFCSHHCCQIQIRYVRFEVYTEVTMQNIFFWGVAPCGSGFYRRFGGTYRLHLQDRWKARDHSLARTTPPPDSIAGTSLLWRPVCSTR